MTFKDLNAVAFERMALVDEYTRLMMELESHLNAARINMCKARTIVGHSYTSLITVHDKELRPTVAVSCNNGVFSLAEDDSEEEENPKTEDKPTVRRRKGEPEKKKDEEEKEDSEEEDDEETKGDNKKKLFTFRPFGVLEPQAARDARHEIHECVMLATRLASCRTAIQRCDERTVQLQRDIPLDRLAEVFDLATSLAA